MLSYPILYHNPPVAEAAQISAPKISPKAVIGVDSMIIGDITIADDVFIGFKNLLRADSGYPYYVGPYTNIQDYVLMHVHPGREHVNVNGRKWGVYLEGENSVLHHAAVHGPLFVGRNTFIGQHANIYDSIIGRNCVIMHGATVTNGVKIPDNRFIAPGETVWQQEQADRLPPVPDQWKDLNRKIVDHYYRLGKSYLHHTPLAFSYGAHRY
ncbi:carbonate dehydratase [Geobacillus stearothermophilus]|nr:UDP-3-O-(3-hydroxymyristoyl) glucosamine N-acyltransferase [Geobacillus sp. 12AMOR1]WJQ14158.1 carbonate dehydratase [Geobacillus stearothermophilus]